MPNKRYQWNAPEEIEGLDEPMIHPSRIPEGFQQYWDYTHKKYMLTKKSNSPYARRQAIDKDYTEEN